MEKPLGIVKNLLNRYCTNLYHKESIFLIREINLTLIQAGETWKTLCEHPNL
ncbi:MAG: hypothetical protein GTN80_11530 [Nitrososphaeria archaeon]|nr:hypothetical protein [Nitrososphaeria archaeon]NIQ34247.1 hypothetical protein [Nitrososphaeria archaeon]